MLSAALLTAAIVPASAAHASAGNQQGSRFIYKGFWQYGVSSTVVWSNYSNAFKPHSAGVQAGEEMVWRFARDGETARAGLPRVAYENYQFAKLSRVSVGW